MGDWEQSTAETQGSVDSALDSMGAPDYTPPDVVGQPDINATTITTGSGDSQGIAIETQYADGSQSHETIDGSLRYDEFTNHPDGSTTYHNVDERGTTDGSTSWDAAGGHQRDEERFNFSNDEVTTSHTETPPELTPEDRQELEGM
jgi:hypothetical protein